MQELFSLIQQFIVKIYAQIQGYMFQLHIAIIKPL